MAIRAPGYTAVNSCRAGHLRHLSRQGVHLVSSKAGSLALAAIAAALCGTFAHRHAWVFVAAIVAVLAIGVAWPLLTMLGVRAELEWAESRTRVGTTANATLRIWRAWPGPWWGFTVVGLPDGRLSISRVAGREVELRFEFVPERRGEYPAGRLGVQCGFPFGLWTARRDVRFSEYLLVWPRKTHPACPDDERSRPIRSRHSSVVAHGIGHEGDVSGVRPMRYGDSLRHMNWRQTARHDRFIVCERNGVTVPRHLIVLDSDPAAFADVRTREEAIELAAGLFERWLDAGLGVDLVIDETFHAAKPTIMQRQMVLDAMARIDQPHCCCCRCDAARYVGCPDYAVKVVVTSGAHRDRWRRVPGVTHVLACGGPSAHSSSWSVAS